MATATTYVAEQRPPSRSHILIKPEWGTKRACPKCNTRFYDLAKDDPVTCINCGNAWTPEPILKSKQPLSYDQPKAAAVKDPVEGELAEEDLEIDEAEVPADDDTDIGGEDELAEVVDPASEEER